MEGADLSVTLEKTTGVITSGYSAKNYADVVYFFHSDDNRYCVVGKGGEAVIEFNPSRAPYIDRDKAGKDVEKYQDNPTLLTNQTTLDGGWYYLCDNVKTGRIDVTANTSLILMDGKTLNVAGITIPDGVKLTVDCGAQAQERVKRAESPEGRAFKLVMKESGEAFFRLFIVAASRFRTVRNRFIHA